ncbi:dimethylaniline monooxygenase [Reticulomyxa filosa]|uniref:Dimethylaniline monooxygenase n=1 Tax=Reticulomyxa filosa TaxID=46433 RepID=X6NAQ2_RETFI|nr:dimethylaniline monooxygenase [Reticulomyxa filosa]|eukprot:ETO22367.1 dimethylaniline monooxygenase [Reticulomyxa filosa]
MHPCAFCCSKYIRKGSITHIEHNGQDVRLSDGTVFENVSYIICCNGTINDIPYLPREIVYRILNAPLSERRFLLFLLTFLPKCYMKSLAFVGIQGIGESFPSQCELQSRLIAFYWANVNDVMNKLDKMTYEEQVHWIDKVLVEMDFFTRFNEIAFTSKIILDEIARLIEVMPDFTNFEPIKDDVVRQFLIKSKPLYPEKFRLVGPNAQPNLLDSLQQKILYSPFKKI